MSAHPDDNPGSPREARSGDYSHDLRFDPESLFQVISASDNAQRISAAMRKFLEQGNELLFAEAVAVFVRSARARAEPIERVLATLNDVAARYDPTTRSRIGGELRLRNLLLRGTLTAVYGDDQVGSYEPAGRMRRAEGKPSE